MSTRTCAITIFLLLAMVTTTFCLQELETLEMIQTQIKQTGNWVRSLGRLDEILDGGSGYLGVALNDCTKLHRESGSRLARLLANRENHTRDDARTWLSGVLANHRTCLDGLSENGFLEHHAVPQNLTFLLSKALALYGKSRATRSGIPRRPIYNRNGGVLISWTPGTSKANFIVAKDGSGTHRTINDALAALGRMGGRRNRRVILYVKAGVYNEKVEIGRHMRNVMFVGDGMDRTIVTGSRNVPDGSSTLSSATFGVSGDGFWARDMTFENTAGARKHQAVALRVSSDHSVFYRCSFKAYQDTLFVHSLRQFYRDSHVYGTIDFIFGDAAAVFQNCDIFVRKPMDHQVNMITAQGREDTNEITGISIQGCRVRASPEFIAVKKWFRSYLGRPWKKYSRAIFFETDIDDLIDPKGWGEWEGNFALSTLFYAEYKNTGIGASTGSRVKWSGFHMLHGPQEAIPFTVSRFIQGESWIPATGVPCQLGFVNYSFHDTTQF